ncbi:hypothetical protein F5B22DRAFT_651810 [Xylaria bambusicola]|uniref:uncharacterized protein n=1 Tax=Xylaria bambusicola TaxID=326684 RepID=UPI00200843FA|nr:uncharacterized protein F5B22DRAFT_651810 [Xylaria bambusicola]KAI0505305.1 hypothetical protein F5B22DRAFT_651810 [Xylaria bambusicola]
MRPLLSQSLLRATRTHPSHSLCSHHLRPSYTITTSRIPPSPLHSYQYGRRAFHWQSAVGAAIEGTQTLMVGLHTGTQLPWFMVIPLVAVTVGTVFRLPFSIYSQRILQRRGEFRSLLQAWNVQLQYNVSREGIPFSSQLSEVKRRQEKVLKRIYSKLGLQQWRLWGSVLSFPFWLVAIDAVRRLCGGPRGLIGSMMTGSDSSSESTVISKAKAVLADTSLPSGSVTDPATIDPALLSSAAEAARTSVVDPALSFEGCLWFTDLTTSDPYHILPLALSATLVWNLLPRSRDEFRDRLRVALGRRPQSTRAQTLAGDAKVGFRERLSAIFHMSMIGLATLVGPLTMDLPAALHLYWLASSLTNALFQRALKHFIPLKQGLLKGCTNNEFIFIRPQRARKN